MARLLPILHSPGHLVLHTFEEGGGGGGSHGVVSRKLAKGQIQIYLGRQKRTNMTTNIHTGIRKYEYEYLSHTAFVQFWRGGGLWGH